MSTRMTQYVQSDPVKNLNILSLDAGGPRGISQLIILKDVMDSLSRGSGVDSGDVVKRPYDVFHAIGGVGTGGLIAIFLVVLKMTATEALEEFTSLVDKVFKDVTENSKTRTERLRIMVASILERYGVDKSADLIPTSGPSPTCKFMVPIMYKNHVGVPCVLRNYVTSHEPPTNLTIAEAMLATCATPPFFTPMSIEKDFATFEYTGGDLGLSNPTGEIITEAHRTFGSEATVACLLSIGCGHGCVKSSPSGSGVPTWMDFLNRITVDSEKTAREMAFRMKNLTLYHRMCVKNGHSEDKVTAWRDPASIATHTSTYLDDLEVIEQVNRCADAINHGDGSATLEQLSHSGGATVSSPTIPPPTAYYVERKEATSFVESCLFDQHGAIKPGSKFIVVTGIGGCGKTLLIRKFVKQYGHRFAAVFFADGSTKETFQRDLVRYTQSLGTAHSQKSFDDSMIFLSQPVDGQRLLVIDNVDDPTLDLAPLLPRWPNGAVIVTSRSASRGQLSSCNLELSVMSLDESVELVVRGSGREWPPSESDREAAIAVAKELGCHPIALVLAINYMLNTGHSAATYIARVRSYREPLLNEPATNQVEMQYKTAFAAFDASYKILPPNAQNVLRLLSLFHWKDFCLDLVSIAAERDFSANRHNYLPDGEEFQRGKECLAAIFCSSGRWSPLEFDLLISSLHNHSLINVVTAEKATLLQMHPLVHEWARFGLASNEMETFKTAAIRLLCCGADEDNRYMMQYISPHIQGLSAAWDTLHVNDASSFAFILYKSGLYSDAAKLWVASQAALTAQLGADHFHTIEVAESLAVTSQQLGRYGEADELQKEVLQRTRALLGVDHPSTVMASSNLAGIYRHLGRYDEAEELYKEVFKQRRGVLGADHSYTIMASNNLAVTYYQQGRYGEAEGLLKKVLQQNKEIRGIGHPETIRASANLAVTYQQLGRYGEAVELQKEVLQQNRTVLGVDHPDTIMQSANLAVTYSRLGRYDEAEVLQREVLRQKRTTLGVDHPQTIVASAHMAIIYRSQGRYGEAEELEKGVLQQRKTLLGVDHPDTIRASASLATTYRQSGRYGKAEELEKAVLQQTKTLLGVDHPDTIRASANLAASYYRLGRYAEAEAVQRDILRRRTAMLGNHHPDTLFAMYHLARTCNAIGDRPEAIELARNTTQMLSETQGETHAFYTTARAFLEFLETLPEEPEKRPRWRDRMLAYVRRIFSL